MILKALKYGSYLILIFGFFYMTYQLGILKAKQHERLHGESVVLMSDCFESPIFTSCKHTYINSESFVNVYQELLNELKKVHTTSTGDVGNNKTSISSNMTTSPDPKENKKLSMR